MSVGRVLTLGLGGSFSEVGFLVTLGYATSGAPPAPVDTFQASNWRVRKKRDRHFSADNWREWLKEEEPEIVEAVKTAAVAEVKLASKPKDPKPDLLRAERAKEAYLEMYRDAYEQAFIEIQAEELERQWAEDVARYKKEIKRRAVMLLLS